MFTLEPKRDNAISDEELNALYEELRPIVFRLAEKLTKDDIININFEVGSVTFEFS